MVQGFRNPQPKPKIHVTSFELNACRRYVDAIQTPSTGAGPPFARRWPTPPGRSRTASSGARPTSSSALVERDQGRSVDRSGAGRPAPPPSPADRPRRRRRRRGRDRLRPLGRPSSRDRTSSGSPPPPVPTTPSAKAAEATGGPVLQGSTPSFGEEQGGGVTKAEAATEPPASQIAADATDVAGESSGAGPGRRRLRGGRPGGDRGGAGVRRRLRPLRDRPRHDRGQGRLPHDRHPRARQGAAPAAAASARRT